MKGNTHIEMEYRRGRGAWRKNNSAKAAIEEKGGRRGGVMCQQG